MESSCLYDLIHRLDRPDWYHTFTTIRRYLCDYDGPSDVFSYCDPKRETTRCCESARLYARVTI